MRHISELISSRQAREDVFYIYNGEVFAYSKIKNLKHKDRFRRVCSTDNYREKLKYDLSNGFIDIIIGAKEK